MKPTSGIPDPESGHDGGIRNAAELLIEHVAGYVAVRSVSIGFRHRLFERLAAHSAGMTSENLAADARLDPFYVEVWCRACYSAGLLEANGSVYRLPPTIATLLLHRDSYHYLAGLLKVLAQPEVFDWFAENLSTGERTWWDRLGPNFIQAVSEVTRPAYIRLIPGGLSRIAGVQETLAGPASVADLACGAGFGLMRLARSYPSARLTGVDGDSYSLELAAARLDEAGLRGRVELRSSTLEGFDQRGEFDLIVVNYSMHECRDIEAVADNVHRALRPGGWFVISDFPFPERQEDLRTPFGTVMSGIQFHEALIGDQLLPTRTFRELLERHAFEAVSSFALTPMHVVVYGRK